MNRRADTIASLLLLVIAVIVVVGLGRYYFVTRQIDRIEAEDAQRMIGADQQLSETVEELEHTLSERIAYQFVLEEDPLDLTRVITSERFLEKLGADRMDPDEAEMRLAATVVAEDGTAAIVIRYLGSNHVLREGDIIEGWKVADISQRNVVLVRNGQRKVLENQPARQNIGATGMVLSASPHTHPVNRNGGEEAFGQ